jgi:hypothetical protein
LHFIANSTINNEHSLIYKRNEKLISYEEKKMKKSWLKVTSNATGKHCEEQRKWGNDTTQQDLGQPLLLTMIAASTYRPD